jgi:pantoate--beta-alanine ligase
VTELHTTVAGFRGHLDDLRADGLRVGLVPTMGYLHEGHASLVRRAAQDTDVVAVTIFVNPLQFAAHEDLGSYPRDLDGDLAVASAAGAVHVFAPSTEEMYPGPMRTTVSVAELTTRFEGATRPEHFAGVATVVAKLFAIAGPCWAYFGEKDFQQLAVVRTMVDDLSLPVEVLGCPIVRDPDGLALSSRNVYLDADQRAAAPVLFRSLTEAAAAAQAGERNPRAVEAIVADAVDACPQAELDYVALVDADTLEPAPVVGGEQRLLVAARFGSTRLLDNVAVAADGPTA